MVNSRFRGQSNAFCKYSPFCTKVQQPYGEKFIIRKCQSHQTAASIIPNAFCVKRQLTFSQLATTATVALCPPTRKMFHVWRLCTAPIKPYQWNGLCGRWVRATVGVWVLPIQAWEVGFVQRLKGNVTHHSKVPPQHTLLTRLNLVGYWLVWIVGSCPSHSRPWEGTPLWHGANQKVRITGVTKLWLHALSTAFVSGCVGLHGSI